MPKRTISVDERVRAYFEKWLTPGEKILWLGWRVHSLETRLLDCAFAISIAFAAYAMVWLLVVTSRGSGSSITPSPIFAYGAACIGIWLIVDKLRGKTAYALTTRRVMLWRFDTRPSLHRQLALCDIQPHLIHRSGILSDLRFANGKFPDYWTFEGIEDSESVLALVKNAQYAAPPPPPVTIGASSGVALGARLYPNETILNTIRPRTEYWIGMHSLVGIWPHIAAIASLFTYGIAHHVKIADAYAVLYCLLVLAIAAVQIHDSWRARRYHVYAITDRRFLCLKANGAIPAFTEADLYQIKRISHFGNGLSSAGTLQLGIAAAADIIALNVPDVKHLQKILTARSTAAKESKRESERSIDDLVTPMTETTSPQFEPQ